MREDERPARRAARDYSALEKACARASEKEGDHRIASATEILYEELCDRGGDWLGFYRITPEEDAMVLVTCKPKPACSPIGLQGVCGRAWRERKAQVVEDVHALGDDHIVCDPENRSEVVVPCFDEAGSCWGVLDVDSRSLSAFTDEDAEGLRRCLRAAGLTP